MERRRQNESSFSCVLTGNKMFAWNLLQATNITQLVSPLCMTFRTKIHLVSWKSLLELWSEGHSNFQLLVLSSETTNTELLSVSTQIFSMPPRHVSSEIHSASYPVGVGDYHPSQSSSDVYSYNPRHLYALSVVVSTRTTSPYSARTTVARKQRSPSRKITIADLLKKFLAVYETRKFIIVFTRARQEAKPLSWRTLHVDCRPPCRHLWMGITHRLPILKPRK
jgi:hypothetical protein